jgi:protein-tyrosine phosphatase
MPGPYSCVNRLERYLECGVNHFIDLTQEDELTSYAPLLQALAEQRGLRVRYQQFPIPDQGVPRSPAVMRHILDAIRAGNAAHETTYVHCWAGIGRTGTVIGCYLAEKELNTALAIKRLAVLWRQMEKRSRFPHTPQTEQQLAWVKNWLAVSSAAGLSRARSGYAAHPGSHVSLH